MESNQLNKEFIIVFLNDYAKQSSYLSNVFLEMNQIRLGPVKNRLRFREQDDLALLREVLSLNPLQDPGLWATIQEHLIIITGKAFSIKTLRDHLLLLIQQWLEKLKELKDRYVSSS